MKRLMSYLALAAVLAGCARVGDAGQAELPITFESPVVTSNTKTVVGEIGSTYTISEDFRAWCWLSFEDITLSDFRKADGTNNGIEFFSNVHAYHSGSSITHYDFWALAPVYYWPKASDARLTLHALSPYSIASDCSNIYHFWQEAPSGQGYPEAGQVGFQVAGFTVKDNPAEQYEVLYSDFTFNTKRSDYDLGNPYDDLVDDSATFIYNGINLRFNHALSSVHFRVKQDRDYEMYGDRLRIFLTGITVINPYKTGSFIENRKKNSVFSGSVSGYQSFPQNTYSLVDDVRRSKWISQSTPNTTGYKLYQEGWLKLDGVQQTVDVPMVTNGTWHVARNVQIKRGLEIVFRKDNAWDEILGVVFDRDVNGYPLNPPYVRGEEFDVSAAGTDISILADDTYDILVSPTLGKARITNPQPDSYYASYTTPSTWSVHFTSGYKLTTRARDLVEKDANGVKYVGGESLLMIPQKLRHDDSDYSKDVKVQIDYTIKYGDVDKRMQETVSLYNLGGQTEWLPGKKYVYTITFGMDRIILDPTVTDWDDITIGQ